MLIVRWAEMQFRVLLTIQREGLACKASGTVQGNVPVAANYKQLQGFAALRAESTFPGSARLQRDG